MIDLFRDDCYNGNVVDGLSHLTRCADNFTDRKLSENLQK